MPLYIDLGVVRIQEYILRTSGADAGQLRKRRGASSMISHATHVDRFAAEGLERNPETYDTEGVAHLLTHDESLHAEAAVERCLQTMRMLLPAAYLKASWARAATYVEARELLAAVSAGEAVGDAGIREWVPAVREEPLAPACEGCGMTPAVRHNLCADCTLRDSAGSSQDPLGVPSPERRSQDALTARLQVSMLSRPTDLATLAALNPFWTTKGNHLATIYADGNNVGHLFHSLRDRPDDATATSQLLDTSIREAGLAGLAAIWSELGTSSQGTFPAVVTVLAADDVLVTVPAPLGWLFVTTVVDAFNAAVADNPHGDPDRPLSLTAGIVFSHVKSPIERAISEAFDVMREAKKSVRGRQSAIGWRDLTQRGGPRTESTRSATWFTEHQAELDEFGRLPAHQRSTWLADLFAAEQRGLLDELYEHLRREWTRLGLSSLAQSQLSLDDVGALLGISRWWTPKETR